MDKSLRVYSRAVVGNSAIPGTEKLSVVFIASYLTAVVCLELSGTMESNVSNGERKKLYSVERMADQKSD